MSFWRVQLSSSTKSLCPPSWDRDDPRLGPYSLYSLSSWTYASMGLVVRFALLSHYEHGPGTIPSADCAMWMCMLQSYISMQSDVVNFRRDSCWHLVDRVTATVFVTIGVCNVLIVSYIESVVCVTIVMSALCLLALSRAALFNEDMAAYVYYHTLWHASIPVLYLSWLVVRPYFVD